MEEKELELYKTGKENIQKVITEIYKNPKSFGRPEYSIYFLMGVKEAIKELLKEDSGLWKNTDNIVNELLEKRHEDFLKEKDRLKKLNTKG